MEYKDYENLMRNMITRKEWVMTYIREHNAGDMTGNELYGRVNRELIDMMSVVRKFLETECVKKGE